MKARGHLAWLIVACGALVAPTAHADEDAMEPYRERFRVGMERYTAGDIAAAIRFWEPIYGDLGPAKGYRLSFDLARAYEKFGDLTRAAERYEAFLAEVDARHTAGQTIETRVLSEEEDAKEELAHIYATKGRIKISAGDAPASVRIDTFEARLAPFAVVVPPGPHTVTFGAGTSRVETRDVTLSAGQLLELSPPHAPVRAPAPEENAPSSEKPTPEGSATSVSPAGVRMRIDPQPERPFSPVVLYAAGTITVASIAVCAVEYARALSLEHDFNGAAPADQPRRLDEYNAVKPDAYVSLGIAIGAGAIAVGLTTWFFAGTKSNDVRKGITPIVAPTRDGSIAGVAGRF